MLVDRRVSNIEILQLVNREPVISVRRAQNTRPEFGAESLFVDIISGACGDIDEADRWPGNVAG